MSIKKKKKNCDRSLSVFVTSHTTNCRKSSAENRVNGYKTPIIYTICKNLFILLRIAFEVKTAAQFLCLTLRLSFERATRLNERRWVKLGSSLKTNILFIDRFQFVNIAGFGIKSFLTLAKFMSSLIELNIIIKPNTLFVAIHIYLHTMYELVCACRTGRVHTTLCYDNTCRTSFMPNVNCFCYTFVLRFFLYLADIWTIRHM